MAAVFHGVCHSLTKERSHQPAIHMTTAITISRNRGWAATIRSSPQCCVLAEHAGLPFGRSRAQIWQFWANKKPLGREKKVWASEQNLVEFGLKLQSCKNIIVFTLALLCVKKSKVVSFKNRAVLVWQGNAIEPEQDVDTECIERMMADESNDVDKVMKDCVKKTSDIAADSAKSSSNNVENSEVQAKKEAPEELVEAKKDSDEKPAEDTAENEEENLEEPAEDQDELEEPAEVDDELEEPADELEEPAEVNDELEEPAEDSTEEEDAPEDLENVPAESEESGELDNAGRFCINVEI
eukprot:gene15062-16617_t